jgi:hypothetical protein
MYAQTLRSLGSDIDETYPQGLRLDLSQPFAVIYIPASERK